MSVNLEILSKRLKQARTVLAYTLEDVCLNTEIEVSHLRAIEAGSVKPNGDEILILAAFYDCDFRGFIDEGRPAPVQQSDILFRRFGDAFTPQDRRSVQEFLYLCETETELETLLETEKERFSFVPKGTFFKEHGQKAAEALRNQLRYQDIEVPRDVYYDFRAIGIHIFRRCLNNSEISGLYVEHPIAGHCVLVNYDDDIYRQRFSAAHEVAHAIFDSSDGVAVTYKQRSSKYDKNDLKEIRANSFASCYLVPPRMLAKLGSWNKSTALRWAQEFRVSTAALAKALKDAGLINDSTANEIRSVRVKFEDKIDPEIAQNLTQLQRKRRLVLLESGLSNYYVNLCFEAHHQAVISAGRLAEALRVDSSDLGDLATIFGKKFNDGV